MIYLTGTGQVTHDFASLSVSAGSPSLLDGSRGGVFSDPLTFPSTAEGGIPSLF